MTKYDLYAFLKEELVNGSKDLAMRPSGEMIRRRIERDMAVCKAWFPALVCRPVPAQVIESDLIALFEFVQSEGMISIKEERHSRIVPNEKLRDEEIKAYGRGQ